MKKIDSLFYELIRVSIGTQNSLSNVPSAIEWNKLYEEAKKQSVLGICFVGIQNLMADSDGGYTQIGIPEEALFRWIGMASHIQQRNEAMDRYTQMALAHFRSKGFACQILKGQGIAKLYDSLAGLRQSGDVDVWVSGTRKQLYNLSLDSFGKLEGLTYHHIHFPMINDCEIEAHTWPAFFTSPITNRRFQKFCKVYMPFEGCGDIPSLAFNRVFILQHCYCHFCGHGVGLRQLLDYYYVLKQGFTEEERIESMRWIEDLGMKRFASALMWLCKEIFGLPDNNCICEPDEKDGMFLLEEVMQSGNMGHLNEIASQRLLNTAFGRYIHNLKRDWQIIRICPNFAIWEPIWGIFQYTWVRITNIKYKI